MTADDWPILSLVTFLPLVGALLILFVTRRRRRTRAATSATIALWTTVVTFLVSLFIWTGFDIRRAGFQFVEKGLAGRGIYLPHGRRRHLDAVRHPDDVPDAALHPGVAGKRSTSASRNTWSPSWCWRR